MLAIVTLRFNTLSCVIHEMEKHKTCSELQGLNNFLCKVILHLTDSTKSHRLKSIEDYTGAEKRPHIIVYIVTANNKLKY